ncbi:MAG: nitrite reductase (NAD(P)H) small subunit [Chitinophagaceae bacterium]|nr:nitrite reductase (NAD(P)H) small subunit [Chitinophagaceae bacterium]
MSKLVWTKVAESLAEIRWNDRNLAIVAAEGQTFTLARFQDQIFACAHKCPHASGIMADGFIDARGQVVCPLHRYRFDLRNGRNTTGEGYYLRTYTVEIREDGVFLGREQRGLFGWS